MSTIDNKIDAVSNIPCTEVGKKFSQECGAKVINMTKVTSEDDLNKVASMVSNDLANGVKMIVIEEPHQYNINPNMLAYYHPKNGGNLKKFITEVWFDQNTVFKQ